MKTFLLFAFVLTNVAIVIGYGFLAVRVVPRAAARLKRTKVGGIVFFFTCACTHTELAGHALITGGLPLGDMASWHMVIIHGVQAVSVWMFVTGLYLEYVKWGPWRAAQDAVHGEPVDR